MPKFLSAYRALAAAALLACGITPLASAATFTVTSTGDGVDAVAGNGVCATAAGVCTLRAGVQEANAKTDADTIVVPAGVYAVASTLVLGNTVTLQGAGAQPGPAASTISGAVAGTPKVRILDIAGTATVTGIVLDQGAGGTGKGGAAAVRLGATLTLQDSTVRRSAAATGGAVYTKGTLVVRRSTLSDNTATDRGGAIYSEGATTIENSTLSGNVAAYGGGIKVAAGTTAILSSTVSGNRAGSKSGGGLYRASGTLTVTSSIVAGNLGGTATAPVAQDCSGSPTFSGVNLLGTSAGCAPKGTIPLAGDAQLGPLADNGGPTLTRAIPGSSPAIDKVATPCTPAVDQRGTPRPGGVSCDLGAFELSSLTLSSSLRVVEVGTTSPPLTSVNSGATQVPVAAATGVSSTGTTGASLAATPLRSVDIDASPLRSVTLEAAFVHSIPLRSVPLRSVLLADVPVSVAGGWDALLAGTPFEGRPLQMVSLDDVITLATVKALRLDQIDLSATVLGTTPIGALLLGDMILADVPLTAALVAATDAQRLAAWCDALPAGACAELGVNPAAPQTGATTTLMSVALSGIPLRSVPLRSVPLRSVPLRSVPLRSVPLRSVPLRSVDLGATPLRSVPLRSVQALAVCTTAACLAQTLAEAQAAGLLITTLSLDDLLAALEPYWTNPALDPAVSRIIQDLTLGDILPGLIGPDDVQWDGINVTALGLPSVATPPAGVTDPTFDYFATFTVGSGPADVAATLMLPDGFVTRGAARLDTVELATCAGAPAMAACADLAGRTLTLRAPGLASGPHTLRLPARAGLVLGTATSTLNVTATAAAKTVSAEGSAAVEVIEAFEPGPSSNDALAVTPPLLNLAHISRSADRDWYRFEVTPAQAARGVRASAVLANLAFDGDLVLFGPADPPLRGAPQTRLVAVEDAIALDPLAGALPTETLADVPLSLPFDPAAAAINVAATRGLNDERIDTAELRAGTYHLQVSGFNGASSASPYTLRLRLIESDRASCTTGLPAADPGALPDLSALPVGLNTVFLVNRQRLAGAYGASDADRVLAGTGALAGRADLGVTGAVIPVDGDPAVRSAYAAWDAAACSPDAANGVVREIGALIDRIADLRPGVTNIVIVGDDTQIPMARTSDGTKIANERTYGPSIGRTTPAGSSLSRSRVLSDNPYGTVRSVAVNGHELFVPRRGVGRLVETPEEILAATQTFQDFGGVLDPATRKAFVAGYDFLTDGSTAVKAGLAPLVAPDALTSLISETWTRADLAAALLPASGPSPLFSSVNAHFDHFRALPAFENAAGTAGNLFTTSDLGPTAGSKLRGTLLFSMGCHSGLSVSDIAVGLASSDWAQGLGARGASLVGNTGYGYGDTETVALSERLMAGFAQELGRAPTIGEALARAKRGYFADTPSSAMSPYDEKVLQQATFYGLPMYRVAGAGPAPPPGSVTSGAFDVNLGNPVAGTSRFAQRVTTRGRFYSVDGLTASVQNRPIQPKTTLDATRTDAVAHGAMITGLASIDLGAFDPVYFRPAVDLSLVEPEVSADDAVFPAAIQSVTPPVSSDDPLQRLVLVPGQFRDPVPGTGIGTQRLFTRIAGTVLYSAPGGTDFAAPRIVSATSAARVITVTTDDSAQRALVLYRPRLGTGEIVWSTLELANTGTSGGLITWSAALPADAPAVVQFFVQAPDAAGNVAVSTNKGEGYSAGVAAESAVRLTLSPAPASANTWVSGSVAATLTSLQGLALEISVDGAPFIAYSGPVTVSGDGVHTITGRDERGASAAAVVRIDGNAPAIETSVTPAPNANGWSKGPVTVGMSANDGDGSGVVSLTYEATGAQPLPKRTVTGSAATLDVTAAGITEVTVTATDAAGRTTTRTVTVRIDTADPTASATPALAANAAGWWNLDVAVQLAGNDAGGSGIASLTYTVGDAAPQTVAGGTASVTVNTQGTTVVEVTATDTAGRTGSASLTVKLDKTAPVTAIRSPSGSPVTLGQLLIADYSCTDALSGPLTCQGQVPNGATIDTSVPGTQSFTVVSTDVAGNSATCTVTYGVLYRICVLKSDDEAQDGKTIPIKLRICSASGANLSSASIPLTATAIDDGPPLPNDSGSSNNGFLFRFTGGSYTYNLQTKTLAPGPHTMSFVVGSDPDVYKVAFSIKGP